MTLKAIFGRRWVRALGLAGAATAGYVFGITSDRAAAQQQPGALPVAEARVVAYIYGNVPITREDLGEFLIARGGHEKLDLLVNKKIIEVEAARRNVGVTVIEVKAGLEEDMRGMGIELPDFVKHILPRYGKTLFEWTEDVIKPRILLGKMCRANVKVTDDDLRKAFENRHGERRQAKVICWNKDDLKVAQKQWEEARKGDTQAERDLNFDRIARTQADGNLAGSCGLIAPTGKYPDTDDDTFHKVLFTLKVGEMSQLFQTTAGIMCVKCVAIVPPDANAKLEGKLKEGLEKEVFDKKLTAEIPKFFNECKKAAQPNLLLKGPPTSKEFRDGVSALLQTGGIVGPPPAAPAAMNPNPVPMPKQP